MKTGGKKSNSSEEENRPYILTRTDATSPFSEAVPLIVPKVTGEQARFFSPRYVPATRELFFQSNQHFEDAELGKKRGVDLWILKGLEVDGIASKATLNKP